MEMCVSGPPSLLVRVWPGSVRRAGLKDFFRKLIVETTDDEEDGDGFSEGSAHA